MFNSPTLYTGAAALSLALLTACGGKPTIPDAPDAAVEAIASELAAGNGGILWEAMPASYQADVNGIVQLAGAQVDAELYNKGFSLLGRVAEVADKQKSFLLNTQIGGGSVPAEQKAKLEAAWPSIIGFVQTIVTSPVSSVEGLQAFDGQSFFDGTVSSLIQYSEDLSTMGGEELPLSAYSDLAVKIVTSTDSSATLEMTAPDGHVETEDFTKVENRWVPAEIAASWQTSIADARAQLNAIDPAEVAQKKPQIMGVITMLEGVLMQIEGAETQEQFDQALQGAMMPIMGLMMMQQGMGGSQAAPAMPTPSAP
jgi:hypothetical protein